MDEQNKLPSDTQKVDTETKDSKSERILEAVDGSIASFMNDSSSFDNAGVGAGDEEKLPFSASMEADLCSDNSSQVDTSSLHQKDRALERQASTSPASVILSGVDESFNIKKFVRPDQVFPQLDTGKKRVAKAYYRLKEAATLADCSLEDILHYGSMGKINLVIHVPEHVDTYLKDYSTEFRGTPVTRPDMLVLSRSYCRMIECLGSTEQSDFFEGYSFDLRGNFKKLQAEYLFSGPGDYRGMVWRTGHDGKQQKIKIIADAIFVMSSDLETFLTGSTSVEFEIQTSSEFVKHNNKSIFLQAMEEASEKFWVNADMDDIQTYPNKEAMIDWFTQKNFSRSAAADAISLIRPHNAKMGTPKRQDDSK